MNYLETLKNYPDEFEYGLGATKKEIQYAQHQLGVEFPAAYKKFLTQCGMCSFGDTRIDGVFKFQNQLVYSVVENTLQLRQSGHLPLDMLVLDIVEQEYLTLYRVGTDTELQDSGVYGAELRYQNDNSLTIGPLVKHFDSFKDYFNDFITLADDLD